MSERGDYDNIHQIWQKHHQMGSPTYNLRRYLLIKLVRQYIKPKKTILDVGCGVGDYLFEFIKYDIEYYGFDISHYAINLLTERLKNLPSNLRNKVYIEVNNIYEFKPQIKFDIVFASEILEHLEDDLTAVCKMASWLKEDGVLIVSVPFDPALWSISDEYSGHKRRYTRESLTKILVSSGLRVIGMYCYGFPLLRIYWNIRKILKVGSKEFKDETSIISAKIAKWISKLVLVTDTKFLSTNKGVGLIAIAKR